MPAGGFLPQFVDNIMKQSNLKELERLRKNAINAIKEYNLISEAMNSDSRLMLADCDLEPYTDYSKHYKWAEETKILIKAWSSSTAECEGEDNEAWSSSSQSCY